MYGQSATYFTLCTIHTISDIELNLNLTREVGRVIIDCTLRSGISNTHYLIFKLKVNLKAIRYALYCRRPFVYS